MKRFLWYKQLRQNRRIELKKQQEDQLKLIKKNLIRKIYGIKIKKSLLFLK